MFLLDLTCFWRSDKADLWGMSICIFDKYHSIPGAVIKPIFGAASLGVVRVDSLEQLERTYVRVQKEMAGAQIVAGALTQGPCDGDQAYFISLFYGLGFRVSVVWV